MTDNVAIGAIVASWRNEVQFVELLFLDASCVVRAWNNLSLAGEYSTFRSRRVFPVKQQFTRKRRSWSRDVRPFEWGNSNGSAIEVQNQYTPLLRSSCPHHQNHAVDFSCQVKGGPRRRQQVANSTDHGCSNWNIYWRRRYSSCRCFVSCWQQRCVWLDDRHLSARLDDSCFEYRSAARKIKNDDYRNFYF